MASLSANSAASASASVPLDSACQALLAQTDDLVALLDRQLWLTTANRALQQACGLPEARLLGPAAQRLRDFIGAELPRLQAACEAALAGAVALPQELAWLQGPAQGRLYRARLIAVHGSSGTIDAVLLQASDITEQRQVEQRLREREHEYRTLAENSPDIIIRYGLDLRAVYCNREIEERVAVEARQVLGRRPTESAPPGMVGAQAYEQQLAHTLASGERGVVELRVPTPDGALQVHSVVISAEFDAHGAICGAVAVGRDVTPLALALDRLAAKEREFRSLAENAGDNIVRWDHDARMSYVNPAMERVLGRPAHTLLGLSSRESYPDGTFASVDDAVHEVLRSGQPRLIELDFQPGATQRRQHHQVRLVPEHDADGRVCGVLGVGRDVTDAVEQRDLIASLARQDPLTRLANRLALHERAPGIFAGARRHQAKAGVMLLDLDGFKGINDGLGHSAGDALLCEVARRLATGLRADDLLVRLGGDEFVVVAPDVETPAALALVADKLHAALAAPLPVAGREVHVTASIGAAVFPSDGDDLEQLLAHADSAMYQAKRAGRACTEFYRDAFGAAVRRRLQLEQALREAQQGAGMALHFQPQVNHAAGEALVGAEALLRWQHPALGAVAPCEFVPLAEETGLIVPLGDWVLRQAADAAARWNRNRLVPLKLAVNVSARQLVDPALPQRVADILRERGCAPQWLTIEITESVFAADSQRVQQSLVALRALGLGVALDDFGTGFSALNYLARFPVDELKIDKSFVHGIGQSARQGELVRAFIAMARALGLALVAEGVETEEQAAFLLAEGCAVMQGWRWGQALPQESFERLWLGAAGDQAR